MDPNQYADYLIQLEERKRRKQVEEDDDLLDMRIRCVEGRGLRVENLGISSRLREDTSDLPFDSKSGRKESD